MQIKVDNVIRESLVGVKKLKIILFHWYPRIHLIQHAENLYAYDDFGGFLISLKLCNSMILMDRSEVLGTLYNSLMI